MKKLHALVFSLMILVLAACGTTTGFGPKTGKSGFDNARTVNIDPHGNIPNSTWDSMITGIGAQWNESQKDKVLLLITVYNAYVGITGAELNIDGEKIILQNTGTVTDMASYGGTVALKRSVKDFSTDLDVVRKILSSKRTWLRVSTPTGTLENAIIDNGKDSKAYHALKRFIAEIDKS